MDILQRKIQNRLIPLRDDAVHTASQIERQQVNGDAALHQVQQRLEALDRELQEISSILFINSNPVLTSSRPVIGRVIVFVKRAIRKLVRGFLGWFYLPIIHQQNQINSRLFQLITREKELLAVQRDVLVQEIGRTAQEQRQLAQRLDEQAQQQDEQSRQQKDRADHMQILLDAHEKHIDDIINLPTNDDQFYHDFEERFRGSFEMICDRVSYYIPIVKEHIPDFANARFVDIGSGRGEWMEVIRANGAKDYIGVDPNDIQNDVARSHGHQAVAMDGVAYLESLEDESVDVVSSFQVIEHLPMSAIVRLMEESLRVLKKGGIILFETNNPQNLTVGSASFYLDPFHKRPLEPNLIAFIAEYSGFKQVDIIRANAHAHSLPVQPSAEYPADGTLLERVNTLSWTVFGPQDYAILGVKE